MQHKRLQYRFIENIPESLEPGVLFVSLRYATAAHLCCCGCGEEVVTPLSPTDWAMTFDGETISLKPSIGNWTLECGSHYLIKRSGVIPAEPWSDRQIAAERRRDRRTKAMYYENGGEFSRRISKPIDSEPRTARQTFWRRAKRWLGIE